jgi:hypothetical protein
VRRRPDQEFSRQFLTPLSRMQPLVWESMAGSLDFSPGNFSQHLGSISCARDASVDLYQAGTPVTRLLFQDGRQRYVRIIGR